MKSHYYSAMKQIRHILFLSLALTLSYGISQAQYTFRVLASSGQSKVAGGKALRTGASLTTANKITVSPRSYLSLVHKSGGTVQISKAGTYSVASLAQKLAQAKASVSKRYATYIISELTKGNKENINKNRYKYMNVTGSVERGDPKGIKVFMAPSNNYFNPKVKITWEAVDKAKEYEIVIADLFGDVIHTTKVSSNHIVIDFSKYKTEDQRFVIKVSTKVPRGNAVEMKDCSREVGQIEKDKSEAFEKAYADFKKGITGKMNAADKLSEAFMMEDYNLFIDALNSFKAAVKMSGNDEAYVTAYRQFLIRNNIGDYAKYKVKSE